MSVPDPLDGSGGQVLWLGSNYFDSVPEGFADDGWVEMMNRAVVGDLAEFFTQQRVAFWNDPAYVDTVNDAVNLEGSLLALGHTVQPFTGTSSAAFSAALANADVVVIPDAGSQQGLNIRPCSGVEPERTWSSQVDAWMAETHRHMKYREGAVADAIGTVLAVSVRHARDNPLLGRILPQDPGSLIPHERDDVAAFGRFYRELLEPALAHGVKTGELRRGLDISYTAELIWLMHFTLIREIFVGAPGGWRSDGEAMLDAAIALIVEGLRA